MKKMLIYQVTVAVLALFFFYSCRLDVLEPELTNAPINQPVQDSRLNYLNYELNAQNFSIDNSIPINFNVNKASLYLSILAHNSGLIKIEILNAAQSTIFKTQLSGNIPTYTRSFSDTEFSRLKISTEEFTGKLILRLTAGLE